MKYFKLKELSPTESAYLAGCVDCDGSISVEVGKSQSTKLTISSTYGEYIRKIKDMAGCGQIYRNSKERVMLGGYIAKEAYQWHLAAKKYLEPFLIQILPYLILKKQRAINALESLKKRTSYG